MREENKEKLEQGKQVLERVKQLRGGSVISAHKCMANDPELLQTFAYNFEHCKAGLKKLEPKTVELLLLALGCARGARETIRVHGNLAYEKGASVEEIGEVLRLVMFYCGAGAVLDIGEIFDEIDFQ
ncbi:MAG: carboxymuconolactone decarboxylase family protein [Hungatella sp.]|nr:carboxymuconolactone decarboxylase family protein [Hungatella sp.]